MTTVSSAKTTQSSRRARNRTPCLPLPVPRSAVRLVRDVHPEHLLDVKIVGRLGTRYSAPKAAGAGARTGWIDYRPANFFIAAAAARRHPRASCDNLLQYSFDPQSAVRDHLQGLYETASNIDRLAVHSSYSSYS